MSADDVSKLAFTYHSHLTYLPEVMAEQPGIMKFSVILMVAVLGIAAAKWLGSHRK